MKKHADKPYHYQEEGFSMEAHLRSRLKAFSVIPEDGLITECCLRLLKYLESVDEKYFSYKNSDFPSFMTRAFLNLLYKFDVDIKASFVIRQAGPLRFTLLGRLLMPLNQSR